MRSPGAIPTEAFPLSWPAGVPRTESHQRGRGPFGRPGAQPTYQRGIELIRAELKRMQAKTIVISTNLPTRIDGWPMASATVRGQDHGAAVYWTVSAWRGSRAELVPHVMTCDRWDRLEHNLHAIALSIEALRALERWGAVRLDQAFAGFKTLGAGDGTEPDAAPVKRTWREVLGVPEDGWVATAPAAAVLAYARDQHRKLMLQHHPDRGGDVAIAAEVGEAWAAARAELEGVS